jgi:hypothetical protein
MVLYIDGIKNPSSFRPSLPFNRIYTTDSQGYQSQSAKSLDNLTFQTSAPSLINEFLIVQDTEEYGLIGEVTV